MSPIVIVTKKNGKIQVYVDLEKVNAAIVRDHYPLPFTKHMLERVTGHEAYSFLDGFSGYNQVSIDPKDQHKTASATTWDVFAYQKMPFGLTNALITFQRLMSVKIMGEKEGVSLAAFSHTQWGNTLKGGG